MVPKDRSEENIVIKVLFNDAPIDLTRQYTVAITETAGMGDIGASWMLTAPRIIPPEEDASQLQNLIKNFCQFSWSTNSPMTIAEPSMGRIVITYEE